MKKSEYSNEYESMEETKYEGRYFEFLYSLKKECPWEEKDFDSIFMYL